MTSLETDTRFKNLRTWFESLGGKTHPDVEIYQDAVCGVSLRARPDAAAPVTGMIVSCPAKASLSYRDAVEQKAFSADFLEKVPPHVIGRFFLVQQFLLGKSSHWHAYIAALPQPGDYASWGLPAVWAKKSSGSLALLHGTNAQVAAETMAALVESEFSQAAGLLDDTYTLALYEWAYCMFTSRSFRPSLVLADAEEDNFSVLLPMLDLGNHAPAARVDWQPSAAGIDFCTAETYSQGEQVFNNYGLKTNSELLVGYGFVLPPTPALHNDYVHLRKSGSATLMEDGASGVSSRAPPSFLLGLRQMADPSSIVGKVRTRMTRGAERSADFGRFEDGLLWDILQGMSSADEKEQLARYAAAKFGVKGTMEEVYAAAPVAELQGAIMDMVFGEEDDDEEEEDDENDEKEEFCITKAEAVRQTLTYKMYMDCKTLRATDSAPTTDDFTALAMQYRTQYRAVLEEAFKSLSGEEYESDDDE